MFQHRIEAFLSQYLLNDACPLGYITDYVMKIEFQMRGSPHAYCLLWVKDAPKIDEDPDDVVCTFIDKYITAVIPPIASENENHIKLMETYKNIHILTTVAETNLIVLVSQNPLQKTLISRPPIEDHDEIIQNAKSVLQTVQNTLTTVDIHNISTQHLLQDINVDIVTYIDALKISKKGQMSFCSKTHKIFL